MLFHSITDGLAVCPTREVLNSSASDDELAVRLKDLNIDTDKLHQEDRAALLNVWKLFPYKGMKLYK